MTSTLTPFDHDMIHAAKARARVRLANGVIVTLIAWRPHKVSASGRRSHRRTARVEFAHGTRCSIPCTQIIEIIDPATSEGAA